ncbi:MAG: pitrilysin family protein [Candidatus Omnitrophota bacterium]|jgi:predicted Zn-dependent peptidase
MHKVDILENGLKVVSRPMSHMESVSLGIWIRAGGRYEDKTNSGISHLLEHLLFKGTKKRDVRKIKEEIEGRGGSFNGFTSEEFTCYLVKLLAKDADLGIDILSDMVLNPRLDEEEIEKEKNVIIEEINMYKDMPAQHVHEILAEIMWPGQPLGLPLAGTVESVKSLSRKDIVAYKETFYNTKNMLAIGAGRIDEGRMVDICRKYLSSETKKENPGFEKVRREQRSSSLNVNFKETEQTHMALGFHAMDRFSPERHALSLVNIILGANMSSRLFHIVRDEMALCYEISSGVRKYEDTGAFTIGAGVDNKKLLKATEVILGILGKMKVESVPEEELGRAKEYYKGQLLFAMEDTMNLMLWLGEKVLSGEKDFSTQKIMENIDNVKAGDIMRVSQKLFTDENLSLAVIGPFKEEKALKEVLHI